jgi:hypothetical protein
MGLGGQRRVPTDQWVDSNCRQSVQRGGAAGIAFDRDSGQVRLEFEGRYRDSYSVASTIVAVPVPVTADVQLVDIGQRLARFLDHQKAGALRRRWHRRRRLRPEYDVHVGGPSAYCSGQQPARRLRLAGGHGCALRAQRPDHARLWLPVLLGRVGYHGNQQYWCTSICSARCFVSCFYRDCVERVAAQHSHLRTVPPLAVGATGSERTVNRTP